MRSWSYKKRNIALITGIIGLLSIGYLFSFSKTIALTEENRQLRNIENSEINIPLKIAAVNKNIQKLDSLISLNQESYEARLLGTLSEYCLKNDASLLQVKDVDFAQYENSPYKTYSIKLEGSFNALVRTMSAMENNYGLGKIQSAAFATVTDRKTKRVSLVLQLYLTRVIINKKQ